MTNPSITHGHGWSTDCDDTTGWVKTEDGCTVAIAVVGEDYFKLTVSGSPSGNKVSYYSYPDEAGAPDIDRGSNAYPKILFRYKTLKAGVAPIKAKIVLVFSDASTQTVLTDTASDNLWQVGSADITAGKVVDHIRLYANNATGDVYYDFALIHAGTFTFPYVDGGCDVDFPPRMANQGIPTRITDNTQNLGMENTVVHVWGTMDTRAGWKDTYSVIGEVLLKIAHDASYLGENWQWLDLGDLQFKVTVQGLQLNRSMDRKSLRSFDLMLQEYKLGSSGNNETWHERFGAST